MSSSVAVFAQRVSQNVEKVIIGKSHVIELLLAALLCEGHVLLEDVPGVGKTMMARALAVSLGVSFKRLQCTPDLLPNDVTGFSVFNQQSRAFEFMPGPVFAHMLLADEINRATPRTQAALLEAMGERQVTSDGVTRPLAQPFMVLATQNPVEYEGTFPLPEAQLDRFLLQLSLGYLSQEQEMALLLHLRGRHPIETLQAVSDPQEIMALSAQVAAIHVDDTLRDYIVRLVNATRHHRDVLLGASPRGSLALYRTSQALAALRGRTFVLPDDIKLLAPLALSHRCLLHPESALRGRSAGQIVQEILAETTLELGRI